MNNVQQGWQCPVCKRVYAPWVPACDKCGRNADASKEVINAIKGLTADKSAKWVDTEWECSMCGGIMQQNVTYVSDLTPPDAEYRCKKCGRFIYHQCETLS